MSKKAMFMVRTPYGNMANILKTKHGWDIYGYAFGPISDHMKRPLRPRQAMR